MIITQDMTQISCLYGFNDVKDHYYLKGYDVFNTITGHKKHVTYTPNASLRYPYVTLERKIGKSPKKCLMHRLIALAYIENKQCSVVEHLNDVKTDYSVENLILSNQSQNMKRAFANGHPNRIDRIFIVETLNGEIFKGTMKEIALKLDMSRQTIYDNFYFKRQGRKIKSVTEFRSTD